MPDQIKQEYIPPTYGALFMDTYLKTHRQRMQTSLALAQQELQTQQSLLSYYAKKEKEYLEFIEGVGTAGTSGGTRKGVTDKKFDRKVKLAQLKVSIQDKKSADMLAIEKMVEAEFAVPIGANVNATARQAALNLSASMSNAETAIRQLRGFTPGTPAARTVAVAFYNQMEAEAAAAGNSSIFNANKSDIVSAIANQVGDPSAAADILSPANIQNQKEQRKQKLKDDIIKGAVTDAELRELERLAGVAPKTTAPSTAGKGPSATALEQEDLMASRLESIQRKMTQLEDSIMEKSTAEAMLRRQKEIYRNQYGKKSKSTAKTRKLMKQLTPEQRFYYDALGIADKSRFDPYNYVPAADGSDSATVQYKANELMNAIIANRGTGKTINVAQMAAKMDPKNAEKIAGLALKGVITYDRQADPLVETKKIIDAETSLDAVDSALEDTEAAKQAQQEKLEKEKLELAKATAPEGGTLGGEGAAPTDLPKGSHLAADIMSWEDAPLAFKNEEEVMKFLAKRTEQNPEGIPKERIREIVGEGALPSEVEAIQKISRPTAEEEAAKVAPETLVEVGTIFKYKEDGKMGYKFTGLGADGQPEFVFIGKDGLPKPATTINEAMYKDALNMYNKAAE